MVFKGDAARESVYQDQEGIRFMKTWTSDELDKIEKTDELRLASLQRDGTLRKPVTIWVVSIGADLYVRAVNGRNGKWFRGTQERHEGHIRCGGVENDVVFVEETDEKILDQIDAAYRTKYRKYPTDYVASTLTPRARSATIKLVPN